MTRKQWISCYSEVHSQDILDLLYARTSKIEKKFLFREFNLRLFSLQEYRRLRKELLAATLNNFNGNILSKNHNKITEFAKSSLSKKKFLPVSVGIQSFIELFSNLSPRDLEYFENLFNEKKENLYEQLTAITIVINSTIRSLKQNDGCSDKRFSLN